MNFSSETTLVTSIQVILLPGQLPGSFHCLGKRRRDSSGFPPQSFCALASFFLERISNRIEAVDQARSRFCGGVHSLTRSRALPNRTLLPNRTDVCPTERLAPAKIGCRRHR